MHVSWNVQCFCNGWIRTYQVENGTTTVVIIDHQTASIGKRNFGKDTFFSTTWRKKQTNVDEENDCHASGFFLLSIWTEKNVTY